MNYSFENVIHQRILKKSICFHKKTHTVFNIDSNNSNNNNNNNSYSLIINLRIKLAYLIDFWRIMWHWRLEYWLLKIHLCITWIIRALIGWIHAGSTTQLCHPVCVPARHICHWGGFSSLPYLCDSHSHAQVVQVTHSEEVNSHLARAAVSAPEGFHPPNNCITFAALRAICGPQYEVWRALNTTIIKGNQSVAWILSCCFEHNWI